ncbi:MAG: polysaccharide lyase [Cyanobacteria bacterium P01_F01_bin.13]
MLKSVLAMGTVALISCQSPVSTSVREPVDTSNLSETAAATPLWESDLSQSDWINGWEPRNDKSWGFDNFELLSIADGPFNHILRVHYPAGTASPSVSRQTDSPLGGAQFYGDLFLSTQTQLRLSYYVRFADEFDFVKGGKLPGLFGGMGASGGQIPNGADGFSARLMWRQNGQGEVYAYLPTSEAYGTSIGRGTWQFQPGIWYKLEQEIKLNTPAQADGEIRIWVNDNLVLEQQALVFRTVSSLQIDGIFFSTFFGGGDPSWATPQDTYIDFANFSVSSGN